MPAPLSSLLFKASPSGSPNNSPAAPATPPGEFKSTSGICKQIEDHVRRCAQLIKIRCEALGKDAGAAEPAEIINALDNIKELAKKQRLFPTDLSGLLLILQKQNNKAFLGILNKPLLNDLSQDLSGFIIILNNALQEVKVNNLLAAIPPRASTP